MEVDQDAWVYSNTGSPARSNTSDEMTLEMMCDITPSTSIKIKSKDGRSNKIDSGIPFKRRRLEGWKESEVSAGDYNTTFAAMAAIFQRNLHMKARRPACWVTKAVRKEQLTRYVVMVAERHRKMFTGLVDSYDRVAAQSACRDENSGTKESPKEDAIQLDYNDYATREYCVEGFSKSM